MLSMCVYMHSRFVKNHLIWILEDGPLISEVVLSHQFLERLLCEVFPWWRHHLLWSSCLFRSTPSDVVVDAREGSWRDYLMGLTFLGGQDFWSGELIWTRHSSVHAARHGQVPVRHVEFLVQEGSS
jgi:hypothetical protein